MTRPLNLPSKKLFVRPTLLFGTLALASGILKNIKKEACITNIQKTIDKFNSENNTDLSFEIKRETSNSDVVFVPNSSKLYINPDYAYDPLYSKTHLNYLIEHELTHTKQFVLMSRLDNGIENLNYCILQKEAANIGKDAKVKKDFEKLLEEINKNPKKYENETFNMMGIKYNLVDHVSIINRLLKNPDLSENDLPIFINKQYYDDIRNKHSKLTPEEEKHAQEYLKAAENYPEVTKHKILNTFSDYNQNFLEKEANKNRPWYTYIF